MMIPILALMLAQAPEPAPSPTPAPVVDLNADPATMSLTAAAMAVITGETPAQVKPTVFIDVNSPLPVGTRNGKPYNLGRVYARLGIGVSPGNSVADPNATPSVTALGNPSNFQSVEGGLGLARVIGQSADGAIKTSILAEVGFKTRRGSDPTAVDSTSHYWGAGFRLSSADGSAITVLGGQDGELGQAGAMQVMVYGQLVLPKTAGIAMLVGDASFSFFAPIDLTLPTPAIPPGSSVTIPQAGAIRSNIVQLGVAIDAAQAFSQLTKH